MKKEYLFEVLGELDDDIVKGAETTIKTKVNWKSWGAMAACLAVVLSIALGYSKLQTMFRDTDYIVTLDNGDTIHFVKSDIASGALQPDADVASRELTQEEIYALFGELPVTGNIYWNEKYSKTPGFSGEIGDAKLVIGTFDLQLLDTVVVGSEKITEVDGVPVTAGYFLTDSNSRGIRTAIFYASFELGNHTIYVENGGPDGESEIISRGLAAAVSDLIENGEIDFTQIQNQSEEH